MNISIINKVFVLVYMTKYKKVFSYQLINITDVIQDFNGNERYLLQ